MRREPRIGALAVCALVLLISHSARLHADNSRSSPADAVGTRLFADSRDPPSYAPLAEEDKTRFDLGHAVFNTHWVPAGTPRAQRRDGLGPLFNADSCDACHNEGARGRGPQGDGPAPPDLVIKLESAPRVEDEDAGGDPVYGRVLNTQVLVGLRAEATITIRYEAFSGRYPDGQAFTLHKPHYEIADLHFGPLGAHTIIEPRIAPAVFGAGLLDAVPQSAITSSGATGAVAWRTVNGERRVGRFGWQATAVSLRDQVTQAFSREMGITSADRPHDDCTPRERQCLAAPNGGDPEVSTELLDAVLAFQQFLAVPESPRRAAGEGAQLFRALGCDTCHTPQLPVELADASGQMHSASIEPYTDLRLHDLGEGLADRDVSGAPVQSRWRTAPLWGMGYRLGRESVPRFLHDGRARTLEEAILWHQGEAAAINERFVALPVQARQALTDWVGTR